MSSWRSPPWRSSPAPSSCGRPGRPAPPERPGSTLPHIRHSLVAVAVVAALAAACGDDPAVETGGPQAQASTTSTTTPSRTYTAELTTTDGRYTVTLLVGPRNATGTTDDCPGTPTPGRYFLPITLTVANAASDRAAPFPPIRVEMTSAPGTRPAQVMVKDQGGSCTFAPRAPSIGPGASLTFKGTSPAIDDAAAPGTAGKLEVKVSENTFTLAAPLP